MITILQAIQEAMVKTGLPSPTTAIGNTDENVISMLAFMQQAGQELVHTVPWAELVKEYTFTLVTNQAAYPFPPDVDTVIFDTDWDRLNHWPLIGPLTPEEWQWRKSGISTLTPRLRYRVMGWNGNTFNLWPSPASTQSGATMVFEYRSTNWVCPTTLWVAGLVAGAGSYCYYGNNIYKTTAGGTCGSTPPTHIIGSASDGTVTWAATDYQKALADTDFLILPSDLIIEGARWRFKREKGLPYQEIEAWCEEHAQFHSTDLKGASTVGFAKRRRGIPLLTPWSIRDSGYGT